MLRVKYVIKHMNFFESESEQESDEKEEDEEENDGEVFVE